MTRTRASSDADPRANVRPRWALDLRGLLLISLVCLIAQALLTVHPEDSPEPNVFWLAVGCLLLWFVYRKRSRAARVILMFLAFFGAALYATQIGSGALPLTLSLLYLGQALPLMSRSVRDHVASPTSPPRWRPQPPPAP